MSRLNSKKQLIYRIQEEISATVLDGVNKLVQDDKIQLDKSTYSKTVRKTKDAVYFFGSWLNHEKDYWLLPYDSRRGEYKISIRWNKRSATDIPIVESVDPFALCMPIFESIDPFALRMSENPVFHARTSVLIELKKRFVEYTDENSIELLPVNDLSSIVIDYLYGNYPDRCNIVHS